MTEIRIPPYTEDSEQAVIGSILYFGVDSLDRCIENQVTEDMFYVPKYKKIFSVILSMKTSEIDLITVGVELKKNGSFDTVGGDKTLEKAIDASPARAHCQYHIEEIRRKWIARSIITECRTLESEAYNAEDPNETLEETVQKLLSLDQSPKVVKSKKQICEEAIDEVKRAMTKGFTGVPSRFQTLNRKILGYNDYMVLAARPSTGKSTLMLNEIEYEAANGYRPGLISIEMSMLVCFKRIASSLSRIPMPAVLGGLITPEQFNAYKFAMENVSSMPIFADDKKMSIEGICSTARRMKARYDIGILWIDYLQIIKESGKHRSRNEQVSEWSASLAGLRKELGIPVVALSQLNRGLEVQSKKPREPRLADLRDSGSIEQDADIVVLMSKTEEGNETMCDIAKNRNGPIGRAYLENEFKYMRFKDSEEKTDDQDEDQEQEVLEI